MVIFFLKSFFMKSWKLLEKLLIDTLDLCWCRLLQKVLAFVGRKSKEIFLTTDNVCHRNRLLPLVNGCILCSQDVENIPH